MVDGAVFGAIKDDYHDRLASCADNLVVMAENCMGRIRYVRASIRLESGVTYYGKTFRNIAYEILNFPNYADVRVEGGPFSFFTSIQVTGNVIDCAEESALDLFLHESFISAEELGVDVEDKLRVSTVTISRMA